MQYKGAQFTERNAFTRMQTKNTVTQKTRYKLIAVRARNVQSAIRNKNATITQTKDPIEVSEDGPELKSLPIHAQCIRDEVEKEHE